MKRCMVDLETLGKTPGCVILSVGAVMFDEVEGKLGPSFYVVINQASCLDAGLKTDADTVAWWGQQSDEARSVLREAECTGTTLAEALTAFNGWLAETQYHDWLYGDGIGEGKFNTRASMKKLEVWGNGADFDNAILQVAYEAAKVPVAWAFWNNRCYRTLKNLYPSHRLERVGVHHNALDDAKTQACHAIQLLRVAGSRKPAPTKWGRLWQALQNEFTWLR